MTTVDHDPVASAPPRSSTWRWVDVPPWGPVLLFAAVTAGYVAGSKLALMLIEASDLGGVFFIPSGITVAVLLRVPRRRWWIVLLAAGLSELTMDLTAGLALSPTLGYVAANVIEPVVGAALVSRLVGTIDLARLRHVWWFMAGAVVAGPAVGAGVGALADRILGGDDFLETLWQWWLGDALGVILVGSAILVWGSSPDRRSLRSLEGAALLVGSVLITVAAFTATDLPLAFSALIGVVVAGVVFGCRAVALTALVVALTIAVHLAVDGESLIRGLTAGTALVLVKLQVGVFTIAGLVVAAEAFERDNATRQTAVLEEDQRREHEIALRLQRALLPSGVVSHPEVAVAARYEAGSEMLEVGGDWYETLELSGGRIGVIVGDVVGHGLEATAAMGRLRTAAAALARHTDSPARLLTHLDDFIGLPSAADMATAVYAILDPANGRLAYASAGHPPMLLLTPDGDARWLDAANSQPLYGSEDVERQEAVVAMEPGTVLVLYSDGLVERRGEALSTGLDRLRRAALRLRHEPVSAVCDRLVVDMGVADERDDDVVVVTLRLAGGTVPRFHRVFPARSEELHGVRSAMRAWFDEAGLPTEVRHDVLLGVGEATINAIEHAYEDGAEGTVEVSIEVVDAGWVQVSVRDFGRWRTASAPTTGRGRGTAIIEAISDEFDRHTGPGGTTVTFSTRAQVPA